MSQASMRSRRAATQLYSHGRCGRSRSGFASIAATSLTGHFATMGTAVVIIAVYDAALVTRNLWCRSFLPDNKFLPPCKLNRNRNTEPTLMD
jgi:hypothetical protein